MAGSSLLLLLKLFLTVEVILAQADERHALHFEPSLEGSRVRMACTDIKPTWS